MQIRKTGQVLKIFYHEKIFSQLLSGKSPLCCFMGRAVKTDRPCAPGGDE